MAIAELELLVLKYSKKFPIRYWTEFNTASSTKNRCLMAIEIPTNFMSNEIRLELSQKGFSQYSVYLTAIFTIERTPDNSLAAETTGY